MNPNNDLQQKIAFYYSKLPPETQAVFSSMKWLETLKAISTKYGLNERQIETLGTETTLVLLGIIHLVEYEENLTNELGLPMSATEKILTEMEDSIIKTIRPQLISAYDANKKSEIDEEPKIEPKLDQRLGQLPQDVEKIIAESNYQPILYDIAKAYSFSIPQMETLEKTVTNLIIGVIQPDAFEDYLENSLGLAPEIVAKIVAEINEKIFKPIRAKLISGTEKSKTSTTNTAKQAVVIDPGEHNILKDAGIHIIPDNPTTAPATKELQEEKLELKGEVHPILAQKLSSSFQTPVVKTEHTLSNISSANPASTKPKIDPYREIPE